MPISEKELDYMAGIGVVVRYQYGDKVTTALLDEPGSGLWQDAAFTNGPLLVRITLEFAPDEAKALAETVEV